MTRLLHLPKRILMIIGVILFLVVVLLGAQFYRLGLQTAVYQRSSEFVVPGTAGSLRTDSGLIPSRFGVRLHYTVRMKDGTLQQLTKTQPSFNSSFGRVTDSFNVAPPYGE